MRCQTRTSETSTTPVSVPIELAQWLDNPHNATQYLSDWQFRKDVDMEFSVGDVIPAEGTLVVLSFDTINAVL